MSPLLILLLTLVIQTVVICLHSSTSEIGLGRFSAFVSETVFKGLKDCKFYIVFGHFEKLEVNERFLWLGAFDQLTSHENLKKHSGGIINLQLYGNQTKDKIFTIVRPTRMLSSCCSATLIMLPTIMRNYEESILKEKLTMPLLNPPTIKNQDKFILFTKTEYLPSIFKSKLIKSLKYKLILTEDLNGHIYDHTFCPFCPERPIRTLDSYLTAHATISDHFPDMQKNYYGSSLKLSASDKVPVLLEISKDGGKLVAKRGVYASVLFHLVKKLNFTYDLVISSGGGSTGHQLSNGTWVGTVGDAYNGRVDFGFMADVTYQRFSVVELCATINFAYLGFATGPPAIIYTWRAIFWPFQGTMWAGVIVSVFISSIIASLLLNNCYQVGHSSTKSKKKAWSVFSIIPYFSKVLIEQGEDCPNPNDPHRTNSTRVFFGFWLLFAIVATTAYKSKIVSFMMFPVVERVPTTFEELAKSKFEIDFHYFGNVAYNLFKTSTSSTFVTIFTRMKKEPNALTCLQRTMTSKSACVIFGITYERLRYRNLSDRIGNSPVDFSPHYGFMYTPGVIHEKKAAFSLNFKQVITTAMEMGLIGEWKRSDLNQILKNKTAWEKENNGGHNSLGDIANDGQDVLRLPNLIGSFVIFTIGIIVGIGVFIGEKFQHGRQKLWKRKRAKLNISLSKAERVMQIVY